ncbi:hypothetical protein [Gilvimarinus agarilyticus]|uniref:hypothetical protein n=1 Tax=Gilvimarinus agarilyticus TaxID=679259 RepID=UPI0005A10543|nr:hypothetical protein [Gilvimarinus agarilyticus]
MNIYSAVNLDTFLTGSSTRPAADELWALQFDHHAYYLPEPTTLPLLAVMRGAVNDLQCIICEATQESLRVVKGCAESANLAHLAQTFSAPVLNLSRGVSLLPVAIPKPWGRELWYTGIEVRGQAGVGNAELSTPLPWLLSLLPQRFSAGQPETLTLLKILDPLPDEVFGDLYFEMHERKQEVYVVTHVDATAWPDGVGGIRFGFCPAKRAKYADDDSFKRAYREAVTQYEQVRRQIDERLDVIKQAEGLDVSAPASPSQVRYWLRHVDADLQCQEQERRQYMDSFAQVLPLRVGDVVKVPCYTPHSLLHGVRTVEFQTPVYERKILAFAQKVLTQAQWDTDAALAKIELDCPPQPDIVVHNEAGGAIVREQIVDFDDFEVWRLRALRPGDYPLSGCDSYQLLMAVTGEQAIDQRLLGAEQAILIPANAAKDAVIRLESGAVTLLAKPKPCN